MAAVRGQDKDAWLALFHEDACVEDPIGVSPIDPSGEGHRGLAAISKFWDRNIAGKEFSFDVHASYAAADSVANHMTLSSGIPGGITIKVPGVFVYQVNEQGKIVSLKGYWEFEALMKSLSS